MMYCWILLLEPDMDIRVFLPSCGNKANIWTVSSKAFVLISLSVIFVSFLRALLYNHRQSCTHPLALSVHPRYQTPPEDERYRGATAMADVGNTGREG